MQKKINKIHKINIHQYKSYVDFVLADDYLTLDFNSKNFDLNFIETISKINFSSIKLIFFSDIPSIVPSKLFDKKYSNKYLETNTSNIKNIRHDISNDKKITTVYSINNSLIKILNKRNIKYSVKNYFTILYDYLSGKNRISEGLTLYINLNEDSFDILIFKLEEFIYFNTFDTDDKDKFLYYLFFVMKNYEVSSKKDKIIFLGKYEKYLEYYETVNKYSQLDYIIDNSISKLNIKSPFFSYLNEDNIRQ
ncbi:MAG: DUF3822 family protein [Bacteroidota bacterium]|nr:DUF3822 family protein [Bacteroidota bacterium]